MPNELLQRGDSYDFAEIQAYMILQEESLARQRQIAVEEAEAEQERTRSQGRPGR